MQYTLIFEDKIIGEIEVETKILEGSLEPPAEPVEGEEPAAPAKSEEAAMANAPPGYVPPPIAIA